MFEAYIVPVPVLHPPEILQHTHGHPIELNEFASAHCHRCPVGLLGIPNFDPRTNALGFDPPQAVMLVGGWHIDLQGTWKVGRTALSHLDSLWVDMSDIKIY